MHKLTLLAAIGAVALSGCDFSSSTPAAATPAPISSIEVANLGGGNWDDDGNPDVFVEIRSASGRAYFRSATVDNADISDALTFDVADVMVSSPTMPLYISVFDFDNDLVNSQEMITSSAFTVEDLGAGSLELGNTRTTITVRSSD